MKTKTLINMKVLEEAAPTLRTVAHPLRLRILDILKDGERTVTEVAAALGKPQALTSHQLAIMRTHGVLSARREGNNVHYAVKKRSVLGLLDCIRKAKLEG
jgi:ArsR family transcriptional regulator